ncbi:CoA transferase [Rhodococcus hoagii]|uniref:CaiB/BaiF CoA-transferase family protein n=1 Tax=Rhodococcus hoagii TaxID=43767 RepID=UPI0007CD4471|nr:CoA transferase [Prescottella equi]MBM4534108.1 CoA transferase [Prescottella equi]NKR82088.1 CoA transferase [Prescottella equi]ORJ94552.1 CoA-transferase [Prescottella equi]ORL09417.1 CoA-transferase [Prescottella equi]ORL72658.1 CoA-transferase [Prescottella equi]
MVESAIRVVELSSPFTRFAGRILVGLGYDVVLVEPADGDPSRHEFCGHAYGHWHAGKKSVVIDLGSDTGRGDLARLVAASDVFLDGSAPGAEPVSVPADSTVHVRVTPFGVDGPRRNWAATDLTVAALGGMLAQVGDPDGPPLLLPQGQAEQLAGVNAAIGALLGLRARRLGPVPAIDVSAQECVAASLEAGTLAYLHEDRVPPRPGRVHPLVPHGLFRAADGFLGGGLGGSPRMWDALLAWLVEEGAADDLTDPRWGDPVERKRHQEHVFEVVQRFLDKWTKEEFAVVAQSRKLPWSAVDRPDELLVNPQLNDRDFFVDVVSPDGVTRDLGFGFAFPEGARARDLVVAEPGEHQALLDDCRDPEIRSPELNSSTLPLDGIRVLDLTWVLAGPYCTRILADHGADVVKVESLGRPDPTRFAPFMHLSRGPHDDPDTSGYFNDVNRNKRSITLDTRSPAGLEVLADLIAQSDVVVENFSSTVIKKMGFGYERLRELRPDIVYVSMSGMGHTGPRSGWVSYADIVSAATGLTALTGWSSDQVVGVIYGHGDIVAGLQAATAVLAALEHRDRTGRGQHVDLSQLEAMASHMGTSVVQATGTGRFPVPIGNAHPTMSPHGVFRCLGPDRWCAIAVRDDADWRHLCDVLGRPDWADDDRLRTAAGRREHGTEIADAIATWTAPLPAETVADRLQSAGVPAGVVQNGRDLVESDPHLRARGYYVPGDHPKVGRFLHEGAPVRVGAAVTVRRAAPLLGADTDDVLRDVAGYPPATIARLRADGVLT